MNRRSTKMINAARNDAIAAATQAAVNEYSWPGSPRLDGPDDRADERTRLRDAHRRAGRDRVQPDHREVVRAQPRPARRERDRHGEEHHHLVTAPPAAGSRRHRSPSIQLDQIELTARPPVRPVAHTQRGSPSRPRCRTPPGPRPPPRSCPAATAVLTRVRAERRGGRAPQAEAHRREDQLPHGHVRPAVRRFRRRHRPDGAADRDQRRRPTGPRRPRRPSASRRSGRSRAPTAPRAATRPGSSSA